MMPEESSPARSDNATCIRPYMLLLLLLYSCNTSCMYTLYEERLTEDTSGWIVEMDDVTHS